MTTEEYSKEDFEHLANLFVITFLARNGGIAVIDKAELEEAYYKYVSFKYTLAGDEAIFELVERKQ